MIEWQQAGVFFLLGVSGAGHCLGMCGGVATALNLGGNRSAALTLWYHSGRLMSYCVIGSFLGAGAGMINSGSWNLGLRYLAGLLLVGMGLYVGNWWRGMAVLERGGALLWRPMQALSTHFVPVQYAWQSLALGLCWGLMPCGLIYSALALAATAQTGPGAGLLMLCFGIGTLPAMLTASFAAARVQEVLRAKGMQQVIALALVLGGLWTLSITAYHSSHSNHESHDNHDSYKSHDVHKNRTDGTHTPTTSKENPSTHNMH